MAEQSPNDPGGMSQEEIDAALAAASGPPGVEPSAEAEAGDEAAAPSLAPSAGQGPASSSDSSPTDSPADASETPVEGSTGEVGAEADGATEASVESEAGDQADAGTVAAEDGGEPVAAESLAAPEAGLGAAPESETAVGAEPAGERRDVSGEGGSAGDTVGVRPDESSAEHPTESGGSSGPFTQADIDAALASALSEAAADVSAGPGPVKLDSAGKPFDEAAALMEAAIAEERAAAAAAAAAKASAPPEPEGPLPPLPSGAATLDLPDFSRTGRGGDDGRGIEFLNNVELNVKIELGRAEMSIEEVLRLGEGSVVELDRLAGDPVDVLVNDRLVARGEVIVLNDNFCVRVSQVLSDAEGKQLV